MDKKFIEFINKKMFTFKILWGALLASIFMFIGVCFIIRPGNIEFDGSVESYGKDPRILIFSMVAFGAAFLSFYLFNLVRGKILAKPMNRNDFLYELKETRNDQGNPVYSQSDLDYISSLDDASLKIYRLQVAMLTPYLLRWALTETVAIMGLLLGQITENKAIAIPFFIAAIILMLVYFPKSELDARMR